MSEPNPPIEHGDEGADGDGTELQFDEAEPTTPTSTGATCAGCKRPITDAYYEINGKIVCTACSQQINASFRGGSGLGRLVGALVFGSLAAVLGAAVYFGVTRATGWNIGYVAIFVGFLVGGAVRKGTGNRGGLLYQFLALFLSYLAVGLMTFAFMVEHVFNEGQKQANQANVQPAPAEKGQPPGAAGPKQPAVAAEKAKSPKPAVGAGQPPTKDAPAAGKADVAKKAAPIAQAENKPADEEADAPKQVELLPALAAFAIFAVFVVAAGPVLMAMSDPLSGLIYCFALWQAWKMNKKAVLALSGPFQVSQVESDDPHALEHDDAE
jgi:hypothetical protein